MRHVWLTVVAAALIPWCEAQKFHVYQLACDNWILLREVIQTICINNTGNTAAVQTLRGQISICFQCWSVHAWLALQKKHIRYHFLSFPKLSLLSYQILSIVMSVYGYRIYNCFVILRVTSYFPQQQPQIGRQQNTMKRREKWFSIRMTCSSNLRLNKDI